MCVCPYTSLIPSRFIVTWNGFAFVLVMFHTVSQSIIVLHGGTITVESEGEGRGTTFSFRLPLNKFTKKQVPVAYPKSSEVDGHPEPQRTPTDGEDVGNVEREVNKLKFTHFAPRRPRHPLIASIPDEGEERTSDPVKLIFQDSGEVDVVPRAGEDVDSSVRVGQSYEREARTGRMSFSFGRRMSRRGTVRQSVTPNYYSRSRPQSPSWCDVRGDVSVTRPGALRRGSARTEGRVQKFIGMDGDGDVLVSSPRRFERVLVVDDATSNRRMLSRLLRRRCDVIEEASNGEQAVDRVRASIEDENPYDLIFMDYVMPLMDGPTATTAIRGLGFTGLIFGLTGNVLQCDKDAFLSSGASFILFKPFDLDLFEAALRSVERR